MEEARKDRHLSNYPRGDGLGGGFRPILRAFAPFLDPRFSSGSGESEASDRVWGPSEEDVQRGKSGS